MKTILFSFFFSFVINTVFSQYQSILGSENTSWDMAVTASGIFADPYLDSCYVANDTIIRASINLYPNPAEKTVHIGLGNSTITSFYLEIFDYTGRSVLDKSKINLSGGQTFHFDVSDWKPGIYFLRIGEHLTSRFLKE
jgi:hypothetical protein